MRLVLLAAVAACCASAQTQWKDALGQVPAWYGGAEAVRIADFLVGYQQATGGWDKNIDMSQPPGPETTAGLSTIDNGATYSQMKYLARVYRATGRARFAASFRRGFEYLLRARNIRMAAGRSSIRCGTGIGVTSLTTTTRWSECSSYCRPSPAVSRSTRS